MAPRILFVVMSAVTPRATVDQLAHSLQPHRVLVHHDFSQVPDFALSAPNASFVPQPRRTGWATFGFVEGIFHALRHAVEQFEFDYLQLLSPTCLPIKPMADFEAHVAKGVDAHFGAIDLLADRDCLMSVGYRAFTQEGTFRHRLLRRLTREYFERSTERRDEAGVWIHGGGGHGWRKAAYPLMRAISLPAVGRHPFGHGLRPYYGSVWFGARKQVVQSLVDGFSEPRLHRWASRLRISEEFLVPSLLMRAARTHGPLNHYISRFEQAHPGRLGLDDLAALRASPAFFARKFRDACDDPARQVVLHELVRTRPFCGAQQPHGALPAGEPAPATPGATAAHGRLISVDFDPVKAAPALRATN